MLTPRWWRRRRLDEDDFEEEIRAHLAIAAEERVADGADPQAARLDALKDFGNVLLATENARRVWTPWWVEALGDLAGDVRYATRVLAKSRAFVLTVVGVLTLGIGLNAAVFTMLQSFYVAPLSGVVGSAGIGVIYGETSAGRTVRVSYPDYRHLRDHDRAFTGLLGSGVFTVNLGRGPRARPVWAELVTGNYFQVLGVAAERGRTLLPSDEVAPGRDPVVVISHGLWHRDFGGAPDIIGRTVEINNCRLTVVGVADPAFHGTIVSYDVEVFIPVMMAGQVGVGGGTPTRPADVLSDRRAGLVFVLGRLRPGVGLGEATAETAAMWTTLRHQRPLGDPVQNLKLVPFWRSPSGGQTFILPTMVVLSAMGLLVLVIACTNMAGLVAARGTSRSGELAMRLALGGSRMRVVRLLVVENLVLALPGAALGVLLARLGIPMLVGAAEALAQPMRVFFNIEINGLVIGFTAAVACGSGLLVGFIPALEASRVNLVSVMNQGSSARGVARGRLRSGLVVAQVAVSLALLVGSGLVSRSLESAQRANPGFEADRVSVVELDLSVNGYDEVTGRAFYRRLLDAARAQPGVESATLAAHNPLTFLDTRATRVAIDGYEPRRDEDLAFLSNTVGPEYFGTLRIPLLAGRAFEERDDEAAAPVAVVNRTLAERFWGGSQQAIGRRVRVGDGEWRMVVGVAADVRYARIDEVPRPYVYLPFLQAYRPAMILTTRGTLPEAVLVQQARETVTSLDADLPIRSATSLKEATRGALVFFRLMAAMLFIFGAVGMALAAMGTYGLVSYTVRQRTTEIGIRVALGASWLTVVGGFLARGVRLALVGAAIGILVSLAAGRLFGGVLFGVSATDPTAFARALGLVLGGVVAATAVPAWRAARTDPTRALRHQ